MELAAPWAKHRSCPRFVAIAFVERLKGAATKDYRRRYRNRSSRSVERKKWQKKLCSESKAARRVVGLAWADHHWDKLCLWWKGKFVQASSRRKRDWSPRKRPEAHMGECKTLCWWQRKERGTQNTHGGMGQHNWRVECDLHRRDCWEGRQIDVGPSDPGFTQPSARRSGRHPWDGARWCAASAWTPRGAGESWVHGGYATAQSHVWWRGVAQDSSSYVWPWIGQGSHLHPGGSFREGDEWRFWNAKARKDPARWPRDPASNHGPEGDELDDDATGSWHCQPDRGSYISTGHHRGWSSSTGFRRGPDIRLLPVPVAWQVDWLHGARPSCARVLLGPWNGWDDVCRALRTPNGMALVRWCDAGCASQVGAGLSSERRRWVVRSGGD